MDYFDIFWAHNFWDEIQIEAMAGSRSVTRLVWMSSAPSFCHLDLHANSHSPKRISVAKKTCGNSIGSSVTPSMAGEIWKTCYGCQISFKYRTAVSRTGCGCFVHFSSQSWSSCCGVFGWCFVRGKTGTILGEHWVSEFQLEPTSSYCDLGVVRPRA